MDNKKFLNWLIAPVSTKVLIQDLNTLLVIYSDTTEILLYKDHSNISGIAEWLEPAPCNSRVLGSNPAQAPLRKYKL